MMRNITVSFCVALISIMLLSGSSKPVQIEKIDETQKPIAINRIDTWDEAYWYRLNSISSMAAVADAVVPDGTDIQKQAVMNCIIYRSKAIGFPNDIVSVCHQKNQWGGYIDDTIYNRNTYNLALEMFDNFEQVIPDGLVYLRKGEQGGLFFRMLWNDGPEYEFYVKGK